LTSQPLVRLFSRSEARRARTKKTARRRPQIDSNIPLEISLFLSGYVGALIRRKTLDAPFVSILFASLGALQDS
jgi:putative membrane protein